MYRFPPQFGGAPDHHDSEFRGRHIEENVGARGLEFGNLRIDGRVRDLVRSLSHDRDLATKSILQALEVVLAEPIVLIKHGDLAVRMVLQQILRIDVSFGLVAGLEAHGPGELVRLVPHRRARSDKQLWDLF